MPRSPSRIGFFSGLLYPWKGARLVYMQHRGLARLWLPPVVIVAAAMCATTWLALSYYDEVLSTLWSEPTGEDLSNVVGRGVHALLGFLLAILLVLVGAVLVTLASTVVAAPWNDLLSEAVEQIQTGGTASRFSIRRLARDMLRTVVLELGKLGAYLAIMASTFAIALLLPGIGQVLHAATGFLITSIYLAVDYADLAAARRGLGVRARIGHARQHFASVLGMGMAIWALMLVPLLNLLLMPAAVAGATLWFIDTYGGSAPAPPGAAASSTELATS